MFKKNARGHMPMTSQFTLTVNGQPYSVEVEPDTPLLYVLRNDLGLNGPQFGCGSESCGACTVLLGAKAIKSCKVSVAEATLGWITTLEGLSTPDELHPVQRAFIDEQAAQCGYCTNGMILTTAALLGKNPHPTDQQIREALDGNLCRCGAQLRILRAVRRAADLLAAEGD
jgi:nicotinate dehydrogenase subunit A